MAKRLKFTLCFAPEAIEHLAAIESKYHGLLRRTIREQLTHVPTEETRNRKPLDQPAPLAASWELRCGPDNRFRIFYDVDLERLMLGRSPRFQALLNRSRQSIQEEKGLSEKDYWEAVRKRAQEGKDAPAKRRRTKRST